MEVVGTMAGVPTSRFFNREMEKTPSPVKEAEEQVEEAPGRVVDYRVIASSPSFRILPGMVVDFTYLGERVPEIEDPWTDKAAREDLPQLAIDKDGTVMELVKHDYIRALLKSPPRSNPLSHCRIDSLRAKGVKDEERIEILASESRNLQRVRDIKKDIIRQYLAKGYAYVALPVTSKMYPANADGNQLPPLP